MPTLSSIVSEAKFKARAEEIRTVNPKAAEAFIALDKAQTGQEISEILEAI